MALRAMALPWRDGTGNSAAGAAEVEAEAEAASCPPGEAPVPLDGASR